jgi:mRNA interferase MazF
MTPLKPTYKRGDVVLVLFPHSDLRTAKTRPALMVQAENL